MCVSVCVKYDYFNVKCLAPKNTQCTAWQDLNSCWQNAGNAIQNNWQFICPITTRVLVSVKHWWPIAARLQPKGGRAMSPRVVGSVKQQRGLTCRRRLLHQLGPEHFSKGKPIYMYININQLGYFTTRNGASYQVDAAFLSFWKVRRNLACYLTVFSYGVAYFRSLFCYFTPQPLIIALHPHGSWKWLWAMNSIMGNDTTPFASCRAATCKLSAVIVFIGVSPTV